MTTSTNSGEAHSELGGIESAADAFLASFKLPAEDAEKPSDEEAPRKKEPEQSEQPSEPEQPEEGSDESPEQSEEAEGEEQKPADKKYVDSDDVFVKVKVGDQELEVPVKDLKRLHGQEAALTRRSQEVAAERKAIEGRAQQYGAKLDRLIKNVTARADEYRKVNFLALAKDPNITAEQLGILQDEARKVFEEENFLKSELNEVVQSAQKEQQEQLLVRARDCVKEITDQASPHHIENFNQKLYGDMRDYAIKHGIAKEVVEGIVDAPVLKLLHKAYMYDQQKAGSKIPTKVVTKTPKKIVKTSNTPPSAPAKASQKAKDAMKTLKTKGSVDAATDAFLARWETDE